MAGGGGKAKRRLLQYNPFADVIRDRGAPVTKVFETGRWIEGPREQWFDDPLTGTEVKRTVLTVLEHKPKGEKANNRTGPRKHHQPQTLNHGGFHSLHGATEIVEKVTKRTRGKSTKRKVTFDKDGCARISVADPRRTACREMGIPLNNEHTVDPKAFAKPSGPKVYTPPKHHPGYVPLPKVKPTVCDYTPDAWEVKDIKLYGAKNQHLKTAVCVVTKGKTTRSIDIINVRSVEEAKIMLKSIHGIE
jgi:hypothetical protein